MAETVFAWILIAMMVLLAIASVKIIISAGHQIYKKFQPISGQNRGPLAKSIHA